MSLFSVSNLAAAIAIAVAILISHVRGQDIAWSGVSEGSVIQLQSGMTATNLTITATITSLDQTDLVFVLERQGVVILSQTSAPPHVVTYTNLPVGKYFMSAHSGPTGSEHLGDLSFDIQAAVIRPKNDDWNCAEIITCLDIVAVGSNVTATREPNEPQVDGAAGKSIWWAWTANSSGTYTATTAKSAFDTMLAVFVGTNVTSLKLIAANDDVGVYTSSQVSFQAISGVTYYFLVDSATGAGEGEANLRLFAAAPPSVAVNSPADGYLALLNSSAVSTNVVADLGVDDPTGIAKVEYWFDGGTNVSRSGALAPPYQLSLTNLFAGHYLLTVAAWNSLGLVTVVNTGLSVVSLEPVFVIEGSRSIPGKFQMGLIGFKGPNYILQVSTNLDAWCSVSSWTNFAGAVKVADTNAAQASQRYFRATTE